MSAANNHGLKAGFWPWSTGGGGCAANQAPPSTANSTSQNTASHGRFRDKYSLNFPLLADTAHQVAERYGAWREKNNYGKTSMGIQRSTFLIDGEGKVRKVWKKVNVDGHDEQVLSALGSL